MKIGVPRALLFYDYGIMWKSFFEALGHEVVVSRKTNSSILNEGVKHCVDDACLPVKVFHGHAADLADKADVIFIPRIISIRCGEYICPKFIGLPEMVKNSIPNLPPLLIVDFNFHKNSKKGYEGLYKAGRELGATNRMIEKAILKANQDLAEYNSGILSSDNPLRLIECNLISNSGADMSKAAEPANKGTIGLIGHPYLLFDEYINMNINSKIRKRNYRIIYPENIAEELTDAACSRLPKKLFWSYGKRLLGSGLSMLKNEDVKGIIFVSSFGCGIDSFIGELLQRFNLREYKVPYTMITLDEHSGAAGFDTRLEAFIDMMEWRDKNGCNVSSYGKNIYSRQSTV